MAEERELGLRGWITGTRSAGGLELARGRVGPLDRTRVAVLPFANMSPDPNDEYFADGMTEEIISTASSIAGLTLIARTSVMGYKGTAKKVGEIAKELNVGTVLEGSVRKAGSKLRITVQLIDAQSEGHIWAQSYDRDLDDAFAIQSDIAKQVADALRIKMLPHEILQIEKTPTKSAVAYALYLKGRYYWNERTKDSVNKALGYFHAATKDDPEFSMAHSGIADCYNMIAKSLWMAPGQAYPLAWESCKRALGIDENLAEGHASLGWTLMAYHWDLGSAEKEFKRAVELRPNYAAVHQWYGSLMFFLREYKGAYSQGMRAVELDPFSASINTDLATYLASLGRTEEAMERYRQTIELNPDFASVHLHKSWIHAWLSEHDAAIEEAKRAMALDGSPLIEQFLAWAYAKAGRRGEAQEILDRLKSGKPSGYVSPVWIGMIELELGRTDEGYRWLEKSLNDRSQALLYFRGMPWLGEYRSDPRWKRIDEKLSLPQGR